MAYPIYRSSVTKQLFVQIPYTFDRWQTDDFIYDAPLSGVIQCLEEEDLVKLTGDEPIKVLREYIEAYSDYIYDWFYEDAYDDWARSDDAPSL